MMDRRGLMGLAALTAFLPMVARAQSPEDRLRTDWPWLGRYADDNARILASGERPGIVFMGDSITEGWSRARSAFFTAGRINRGISGQTTPQMVLRMMADVIALRPRVLHLMAGTNDVAGNTGPMTVAQTQANLTAMCQLARANGIAVLLASVPPADRFPWKPGVQPAPAIRSINSWIRGAAGELGATFVDYTPALGTATGAMKPDLANDGVHPTGAGYDAMAGVLSPILRARNV